MVDEKIACLSNHYTSVADKCGTKVEARSRGAESRREVEV